MRASLDLLNKTFPDDDLTEDQRAAKNAILQEVSDALDALHDIRGFLSMIYEMKVNKLHGL